MKTRAAQTIQMMFGSVNSVATAKPRCIVAPHAKIKHRTIGQSLFSNIILSLLHIYDIYFKK